MADPATTTKSFYGGTAVPKELKFGSLIYSNIVYSKLVKSLNL